MRPRILGLALILTAFVLLVPDTARAQRYMGRADNPVGPTVSPYLNLTQTNILTPTNYQSLVKPLIDQDRTNQRQAYSLGRLQQQVNAQSYGGGGRGVRGTGHATFFMNYSHYYPSGR